MGRNVRKTFEWKRTLVDTVYYIARRPFGRHAPYFDDESSVYLIRSIRYPGDVLVDCRSYPKTATANGVPEFSRYLKRSELETYTRLAVARHTLPGPLVLKRIERRSATRTVRFYSVVENYLKKKNGRSYGRGQRACRVFARAKIDKKNNEIKNSRSASAKIPSS